MLIFIDIHKQKLLASTIFKSFLDYYCFVNGITMSGSFMDKMSQLVKFISHTHTPTEAVLADFLKRLNFEVEDLLPWKSDVSKENSIDKKYIHQDRYFEIMLVTWHLQASTRIQLHKNVDWGALQVFGHVLFSSYKVDTRLNIKRLKEKKLNDKALIHLKSQQYHQIRNIGHEDLLVLQILGCDKNPVEHSTEQFFSVKNRLISFSKS